MFYLARTFVHFGILKRSQDHWQALVAFVIPSSAYDQLYLEQLEKSCKLGNRRKFMWISRKELIDQVVKVQTGGPVV
jgi:hypothetical protein